MAKQLSGKPKPRKAKAKTADDADTGHGHNSVVPKKALKDAFDALDWLHNKKDDANAEFTADIKQAIEDHAGKLGVKKSVLRMNYNEHRHLLKRAEKLEAMDFATKDDHDRLMAAAASFGDTPFGNYARAQAGTTTELTN